MFDTGTHRRSGPDGRLDGENHQGAHTQPRLGWNRTRATAEQALADGSIDAIATEALYKEADLVIIGLYPQATVDWLLENMPKMKKGCVIVDMVGVKQFMVDHLEQAALDAGVHYVGGHPMAGREFSGLDFALPTCLTVRA